MFIKKRTENLGIKLYVFAFVMTVIVLIGGYDTAAAVLTPDSVVDSGSYVIEYYNICQQVSSELLDKGKEMDSYGKYELNFDGVTAIFVVTESKGSYCGCISDDPLAKSTFYISLKAYTENGEIGVENRLNIEPKKSLSGDGVLELYLKEIKGTGCPQCGYTGMHYMNSSALEVYRVKNYKPSPTPSPTPTPVPTATPTPVPTMTPTPSPVPTTEPVVTPTPVPTQIPTPTPDGTEKYDPGELLPTPDPSKEYGPSNSSSAYVPIINPTYTETSSGGESGKTGSDGGNSSTAKVAGSSSEKIIQYSDENGGSSPDILPEYKKSKKNTSAGDSQSDSSDDKKKTLAAEPVQKVSDTVAGRKTVMKNGVLYVVESDEDVQNESIPRNNTLGEETFELENAYSQNDLSYLAQEETLTAEKGFFSTTPGRLVIALIILALLILLLFILFFGVIVLGEIEENDDVFDLCAITFLRRKDGNWCVYLKDVFEENAAVKLKLGILFTLIFKQWELTGITTGNFEGCVVGEITRNMMLLRKKIRRNV